MGFEEFLGTRSWRIIKGIGKTMLFGALVFVFLYVLLGSVLSSVDTDHEDEETGAQYEEQVDNYLAEGVEL